jgi:Domain of unknown function (DUF6484)
MKKNTADSLRVIHPEQSILGVRTGRIVHIDGTGIVRVDYPGNHRGPLPAKLGESVEARLCNHHHGAGDGVLLVFEEGDPARPVIFDLLKSRIRPARTAPADGLVPVANRDPSVNGETIHFDAEEQIVLRCGKASITLTKAGKIIIRGAYLLSRSSGANSIKGASVRIN